MGCEASTSHPERRSAASSTLGPRKEGKTKSQNGSTHIQGQHGICGDQLPHDPDTRGDDGASFSQQASSSNGSSLKKPSFPKNLWLRGPDLNRRFQVQSLTEYRSPTPRSSETWIAAQIDQTSDQQRLHRPAGQRPKRRKQADQA